MSREIFLDTNTKSDDGLEVPAYWIAYRGLHI
jgi:hypothetical protein